MPWILVPLAGALAAVATMVLTPWVMRLAVSLEAVDRPGGRKQHRRETPRLGGISIVAGILCALFPAFLLLPEGRFQHIPAGDFLWLGIATSIIFILGVTDDLRDGLGPHVKLAVELLAASLVVAIGWQFTAIRLPTEGSFELGILSPVLSVVWIVGVTNAINFIDGLDGLAAGIVAIIATSLAAMAGFQENPETAILAGCIGGACLGFLRHNWRPAKIFMGDSGSLTLGFMLATVSLGTTPSIKASTTVVLIVPILALGLPVFDTLLVMWFRFLRGHRLVNRLARMLLADRAHIHHLLLDRKTARPRVILLLYGLVALFCAMALVVATSRSWQLAIGFLAVEFLAVVLVRRFGMRGEAKRLAASQLDELEPMPTASETAEDQTSDPVLTAGGSSRTAAESLSRP